MIAVPVAILIAMCAAFIGLMAGILLAAHGMGETR
jgi:hypothetical protein